MRANAAIGFLTVLNMYADCTSERSDMKRYGGSCDDVRNHKNLEMSTRVRTQMRTQNKKVSKRGGKLPIFIFVVYRLYETISQRLKAKKKRNVQD